jgi:DMSO/TMAO reductase YedYZ molybdopterin-dependent catalytic subunit
MLSASASAGISNFDRRAFLRRTGLAAAPWLVGSMSLAGAAAPRAAAGDALIVREKDPENLEFPFSSLSDAIIPNERFYVRNHFALPRIDVKTWRLRVEGAVKKPVDIEYQELRKLKPATMTATLECAGNNRAFLVPKARGVAWQLGAVGNAEWTGVPLAEVLDRAGVRDSAVEVILEGADSGAVTGGPAGNIAFARSLPIAKARRAEVVLAYRMNGVDLPAAHGFPLRALVAGWYGMASIKWLKRIIVTDRPFAGYFQTMDYSYFENRQGLSVVTPITEMQVKAQIARPTVGEVVPLKQGYRVHGAAWAGEANVARVEISDDGGKTWAAARLLGKETNFSWRLWEYSWVPRAAGRVTLMARARDTRGRIQSLERDTNLRNYVISHVLPVDVTVK